MPQSTVARILETMVDLMVDMKVEIQNTNRAVGELRGQVAAFEVSKLAEELSRRIAALGDLPDQEHDDTTPGATSYPTPPIETGDPLIAPNLDRAMRRIQSTTPNGEQKFARLPSPTVRRAVEELFGLNPGRGLTIQEIKEVIGCRANLPVIVESIRGVRCTNPDAQISRVYQFNGGTREA